MRKFFGPTGSVSRITVESEALKSNMLGDPSVRAVDVYVPAGHDGRDCRCSWISSALRRAACLIPIGPVFRKTCRNGSTG